MTERVGDPARAPRSLTVHYPAAPVEGPATVLTTVERAGRSVSYCSARLLQDGRLRALALAAFSTPWDAPVTYSPTPPDLTPAQPDQLQRPPLPVLSLFDMRLAPTPEGWDVATWMQPLDGVVDAPALAALSDMSIPTISFHHHMLPLVPTVDLTVHFRSAASPEAGPVLCRFRTSACAEGFWDEDGELWSADGRLLAHSRQLSVVLGA